MKLQSKINKHGFTWGEVELLRKPIKDFAPYI
jgi:hypothetical protein